MSNDRQSTTWKYLALKPGSLYRQLFVKGTRIAARVLYSYYVPGEDWPGMTPEEIAADFKLPVEAVREAIAYCQSNPPEICEDWEREEALIEASGANEPGAQGRAIRPLTAEDYARIFRR
jgi:uncharacterized protein (DUF433 family)